MAYRAGCRGTVLGAVIWQLAGRARSPGFIPSSSKRFITCSDLQTSSGFTNIHIQFVPAVFSAGIMRMGGKADRSFLSDSEDDKDE
jgi:hypothetical protein